MFTHLSKRNKYHIYNIKGDKIIRDDFMIDFKPLNFIEAEFIELPNLSVSEVKSLIVELRDVMYYDDMVKGFAFNIKVDFRKVRATKKTENVKKLLKFILR